MDRVAEFEKRIDELIEEFSDLSYQDMADSFEYFSNSMQAKVNRE